MMSRYLYFLLILLFLVGPFALPIASMTPPAQLAALQDCANGGFSTEEDFTSIDPAGAVAYYSDGDLLSFNGQVCARNADLLQVFYREDPPADLGLDAVHVLDVEQELVAFSTELDDLNGNFTAGDLLFTNGAIIPNLALVSAFNIPYDIGLDGVHLVGAPEDVLEFVNFAATLATDDWLGGRLQEELDRYNIDIWFSIEGTHVIDEAAFILDGDLLSATGIIVFSNDALLPATVPAGLPDRGVDFGLDAIAGPRQPGQEPFVHFSTEILYRGEPSFTDGDVLLLGNGVLLPNEDLIQPFYPRSDFLGLDALSTGGPGPQGCVNRITDLGGLQVDVADINVAGRAEIGYPTDHPFGSNVPFWGTICDDVLEFRIVFRDASLGAGSGTGIPVLPAEGWMVKDLNPITGTCIDDVSWSSDADGWYNGAQYRDLLTCNPNLILTNWKSASAPDPEVLYRVWLEFDRGLGVEVEPTSHLVRLDNTPPEIKGMDIPGGVCAIYGSADMPITVQGEIADAHFWGYRLFIDGNSYPGHFYPRIDYTSGVSHLNSTGTTPAGLVNLGDVSVFDLVSAPDQPVDCAYSARVYAWDRTIMGAFIPAFNLVGGSFRTPVHEDIYFNFAP
jgi:hypothetical protein